MTYSQEQIFLEEEVDHYRLGMGMAKKLLALHPDAIYCLNDHIAFGVLASLRKLGVSVPEKIAVIGNDNIDPARFVVPPLTSVDMMLEDCGRLAGKLLLNMLAGEKPAPFWGPVKFKAWAPIMEFSEKGAV